MYTLLKYASAAVIAAAYVERHHFRQNKDRSIYCPPKETDPRKPLAQHIQAIVERTPSLLFPNYAPPFWIFNSWINLIVFIVKQRFSTYNDRRQQILHREYVATDENATATLSIDYLNDKTTQLLPSDAPLLLILPTITGSGPSHTYVMKMAAQRGWRTACLNRRGLADSLTTPRFNVMGDQDDTVLQVNCIKQKYPESKYTSMMGLSAGSGLLVTYLGSTGKNCGVDAATCLCPAYDINQAFKTFRDAYPYVDQFLLKDVQKKFILQNETLLRSFNNDAVNDCCKASSVDGILRAQIPFTGSCNEKEFFIRSNPMEYVFGIRCPVMIVNSSDDMVCLPENIREDIAQENGGVLLVRTEEGSHIAYSEGMFGSGNYLIRISLDFLESAMAVGATVEDF
tara:strand:+ start:152 stop:1345 length:1194 start_codon:yes stop_codon:yes gene_type:complete